MEKNNEHLKAKEFVLNAWGIFWLYEDREVMWLSREGQTLSAFNNLPIEVKDALLRDGKISWESSGEKGSIKFIV